MRVRRPAFTLTEVLVAFGVIGLIFSMIGSSAAYGADAIAEVQNRLRATLQYRAAITALDVEFRAKGAAPEEYVHVRRFRMLDDLRKQEDWIDGRHITIINRGYEQDAGYHPEGTVRELTLFDGERHALYSDAVANSAMSLIDRDLMPKQPMSRFHDARLVGMIAWDYRSMLYPGPEPVYLSKKAFDGRIERVGATEVLSWRVVWPLGAAVQEVTLDPAVDGQPTHVHHSWTDELGRHVNDVRVEYAKTNGVFFPSKIAYERFDDDVRTSWENVDVRVFHLNEGLRTSDFSLARADVPPLTPVSWTGKSGERLWWDGQEVVGLEQLQADQARRRTIQWSIAGVLGIAAAGVTFVLLRRRKK